MAPARAPTPPAQMRDGSRRTDATGGVSGSRGAPPTRRSSGPTATPGATGERPCSGRARSLRPPTTASRRQSTRRGWRCCTTRPRPTPPTETARRSGGGSRWSLRGAPWVRPWVRRGYGRRVSVTPSDPERPSAGRCTNRRNRLSNAGFGSISGGGGIRTLDGRNPPITVFETAASGGLCLQIGRCAPGARPYARQSGCRKVPLRVEAKRVRRSCFKEKAVTRGWPDPLRGEALRVYYLRVY